MKIIIIRLCCFELKKENTRCVCACFNSSICLLPLAALLSLTDLLYSHIIISFIAHHLYNSIIINNSCPSASLDYIIEPWFLGPGSTGPGGPEFAEWADSSTSKYGTKFITSVADLPTPEQPRVALISGRTADNPRLLNECIDAGCKCIYLEKPGAPTVKELEEMKSCAEEAGIEVLMGYNKVRRMKMVGWLYFCV